MTDSIAPPDTGVLGDRERPKRIFKIIVIGDSHVGREATLQRFVEYLPSLSRSRENLLDLSILFGQVSGEE